MNKGISKLGMPFKKNKPAPPESGAQADSKIGGSVFLDCFNRAVVNAGATVNASVSDSVSHDIPSICMIARRGPRRTYILACILENAIPFLKESYKFSGNREKFPDEGGWLCIMKQMPRG